MSLNSEDRKALIAYRHEKADRALEDAAFLTGAGKYGLAANRLYYALFHAASALLLSKGITTKRHSGLITQVHLHFVKTGILTTEEACVSANRKFVIWKSCSISDTKTITKILSMLSVLT